MSSAIRAEEPGTPHLLAKLRNTSSKRPALVASIPDGRCGMSITSTYRERSRGTWENSTIAGKGSARKPYKLPEV